MARETMNDLLKPAIKSGFWEGRVNVVPDDSFLAGLKKAVWNFRGGENRSVQAASKSEDRNIRSNQSYNRMSLFVCHSKPDYHTGWRKDKKSRSEILRPAFGWIQDDGRCHGSTFTHHPE